MKRELIEAVESAPFSALQACKVLGLNPDRFYQWRSRESLIDKPPLARLAPHKLLKAEREEIIRLEYPEQRHRDGGTLVWYNLAKEEKVYTSPSSV